MNQSIDILDKNEITELYHIQVKIAIKSTSEVLGNTYINIFENVYIYILKLLP